MCTIFNFLRSEGIEKYQGQTPISTNFHINEYFSEPLL